MIRPSSEYVVEYAGAEARFRIERLTAAEATQAVQGWSEVSGGGASQIAQIDFAERLLFGDGRDLLVEASISGESYSRATASTSSIDGRAWWQFYVPYVMQMELVTAIMHAGVGKFAALGKGSLLGPAAPSGQ